MRIVGLRIVAMIVCAMAISAGERVSADSSLFNGIQQDAFPDIVSTFGTLTYNTGSDQLQINAFPDSLNKGPGSTMNQVVDASGVISRSFQLNATIPTLLPTDLNGKAIIGTLNIVGKVPTLGFNSGSLLTGAVTAFRSPSAQQMEFLFTVTGGDAALLYGGFNAVGIVVIPAITPAYDRFFNTSYIAENLNFSTDTASTTIVPEPGSFLLAMFGIIGIAGGARLHRKRRLQS